MVSWMALPSTPAASESNYDERVTLIGEPNGRASTQDRQSKFVTSDIHHACKGQIHGLTRHEQPKKEKKKCVDQTSHSPSSCPSEGCQDHGGNRCCSGDGETQKRQVVFDSTDQGKATWNPSRRGSAGLCLECACHNPERPERHTHRGLRHDSVPALHVEPIHARLRQLRIVIQEFEQDDVEVVAQRPESKHAETTETKAQTWAKGRLNVRSIAPNQTSVITKNVPGDIFFITALINSKKMSRKKLQISRHLLLRNYFPSQLRKSVIIVERMACFP